MAKGLNKSRMRNSWMMALVAAVIIITYKPVFEPSTAPHQIMNALGFLLVAICVFGRIYSTIYLGGHKNQTLITQGPFSVVRNPLYVFSWIGVLGLSIVTMIPYLIILLPTGFLIIYHFLIKREEAFLAQNFGKEFELYTKKVPRLIPDFSLFETSDDILVKPKFVKNAIFDAVWWFIGFLILENIELLLGTLYRAL